MSRTSLMRGAGCLLLLWVLCATGLSAQSVDTGVLGVVTDGSGQYRIIDLPPGVYTLAATLPGFSTYRREGLELSGSVTLTIPVQMNVGALQETITVTGEAPVVDVQNTRREVVVNQQVISAIPATRTAGALLNPLILT